MKAVRELQNLPRNFKADVFFLQETKMGSVSKNILRSTCVSTFVDWIHLASLGASHGLLLLWYKQVVEKLEDFR